MPTLRYRSEISVSRYLVKWKHLNDITEIALDIVQMIISLCGRHKNYVERT